VRICFEPGIYTFATPLIISNRKVILAGCPRAVLVAEGIELMIRVQDGGRLELQCLVLFGRVAGGARVLVDLADNANAMVAAQPSSWFYEPGIFVPVVTLAVRVGDREPSVFDAKPFLSHKEPQMARRSCRSS
jgi:hypothetical protein